MFNKVALIIQARNNSSRLPGKVTADIAGRTMIEFQIERLKRCKYVDEIFIATTCNKEDDVLERISQSSNIRIVRGSEHDVLRRFREVCFKSNADIFIRITGDCPLIDPLLIDKAINIFKERKPDYLSNISPPTFPDGQDIEIFTRELLIETESSCNNESEREHVTPWMRHTNKYRKYNIKNDIDYSDMRWTVDEPEDLKVIRLIVKEFKGLSTFSWNEIIDLYEEKPHIFEANKIFQRNEGSTLSKGKKLWRRAKRVIPGGNMLLSKRPEMFLPEKWPNYFKKAKDCYVWDLDGRKLIDMSIMGIGTNILGYGHPEVDEVVQKVILNGNMSTLNCPEEVYLAEKLIDINPWSEMVRFARTGGEANAISIRIARTYTGKDIVAICGYHGWHDWYLATNLKDQSGLDEHLLPGLNPTGVPKNLKGTVLPFQFNCSDEELEKIFKNNKLAAIKMEVQRSIEPRIGFLEKIRELCHKYSVVLIFDECTSGFRETLGGIHQKYNIFPDMAIYGKALGNGYAITAVIGKRDIMQASQDSFISSTFWTERIGPSAAIKTIEVMEREKSWEQITTKGNYVRLGWERIANKYGLQIEIQGIPSLSTFRFISKNSLEYKTIFTQEMLVYGYLASSIFYPSIKHDQTILREYLTKVDKVFSLIRECEDGMPLDNILKGPVCHQGFKRLN